MRNLLTGNAGLASQEQGPRSDATAMVAGGLVSDSIVNIGSDEGGEDGRLAKRQRVETPCNSERGANVVHQQGHTLGSERISPAVEQGDVQIEDTRLARGEGNAEESAVWGRRLHEFLSQESVPALEVFEGQLLEEDVATEAASEAGPASQGRQSSDQYRGAEADGEGLPRMCLPLRIAGSMMSAQVPSSRGAARNEGPGSAAADGSGNRRGELRGRASKRKTRTSGARGHDLRQGDSRDGIAPPEIIFRIGWASSLRPMLPGTSVSFIMPCFLMTFFRREQQCRQAFRTRSIVLCWPVQYQM